MPRIAAILVYPVEGCRGVRVKSCSVSARGLTGDRRFKVVCEDGAPLAEEAVRTLSRVSAESKGPALWVSAARMERCVLDATALADASAWFTRLLVHPVRCVHLEDHQPSGRLLATTTSSLAALNQQLPKSVTLELFGPHLVLEGTDPFEEESWAALEVGGIRCAVAPHPHTLRPHFGVTLVPELSGASQVQLRAGQGLDITRAPGSRS